MLRVRFKSPHRPCKGGIQKQSRESRGQGDGRGFLWKPLLGDDLTSLHQERTVGGFRRERGEPPFGDGGRVSASPQEHEGQEAAPAQAGSQAALAAVWGSATLKAAGMESP